MRRLFKWLGIVVAVVLALGGVAYAWVSATWNGDYSAMARPAIVASTDPAVIAHGEYVFNAVAHCSICHGPTAPKRKRGDRFPMAGGLIFHAGPFGTFVARNLTSDRETGVGAQSDADLARVVRSGVDHQGRFLPFMKLAVGPIADEDLAALISYMRTFAPVRREEEPEVWGLVGKYLAATKLKPATQVPPPYVPAVGGAERGPRRLPRQRAGRVPLLPHEARRHGRFRRDRPAVQRRRRRARRDRSSLGNPGPEPDAGPDEQPARGVGRGDVRHPLPRRQGVPRDRACRGRTSPR